MIKKLFGLLHEIPFYAASEMSIGLDPDHKICFWIRAVNEILQNLIVRIGFE